MTDQRSASSVKESWFSPGVAGIGSASFLSDVGHEVPTALLPSLLTSLGAPAAALGLIEGIANAAAGLARLAGGPIADDPASRKRVAIGGYMSTALFSSLIGVASAAWQVGAFRLAAWTARGIRVPARNALLADMVSPENYGRAYGFERAMDNLGAIVGPLLALLLVSLVGIRTAILISVFPGLLAAAAIWFSVRQVPRFKTRKSARFRMAAGPLLKGGLGRLFLGLLAFELGNVAATILILRATQALTPEWGEQKATQIALMLYVAYNTAATLISVPAGHISDRRGAVPVLAAAALLFSFAFIAFAFAGLSSLAAGFVLAGIAIGCSETAQSAAVASLAPETMRGSAFGLLAGMQSFGNLAASSIAGVLWTFLSPAAAFIYLATLMLIGAATIILSRPSS
ncbi:MAG TPA: MFS transporter [Rhizomicrobium sp.]|nr:MFS transporter [Rhizomicrobium sp.]